MSDTDHNETNHRLDSKILEARRDFDAALEKIKPSRRRKNLTFDEEAESFVSEFKQRMLDAAEKDINSHTEKKMAVEKLKMLPEVQSVLIRKDMQLFLLDGGILDVLRVWLEPYEDGTLASIDLKDAILEVLNKMDIETDHLKESGIGKVIMFMYKCPREISSIRRKSNELINKWSRPILGQGMLPPPPAVQSSAQTRGVANGAGEIDMDRLHASIPKPALFDYTKRPESKIDIASIKELNRTEAAQFKGISDKLKKRSSKEAANAQRLILKPSIEGKGVW